MVEMRKSPLPSSDSSRQSAASSASMIGKFMHRGGLWVIGQAAILVTVFLAAVPCHRQWHSQAFVACGWLLIVLASICGVAGAIRLGPNLTPFPKPAASSRLVKHGIYRFLRHPLYTAVFCGSLGWAFLWRSWPALIAALCLAPFFDAKARREERWLRQQFPEYQAYEQRVRRFIPWLY
jgi:protein-S-isoprenylcysteine O-methyltransferase Ste14